MIMFCGGMLLGLNSGDCACLRLVLGPQSLLQHEKRVDVNEGGEELNVGCSAVLSGSPRMLAYAALSITFLV